MKLVQWLQLLVLVTLTCYHCTVSSFSAWFERNLAIQVWTILNPSFSDQSELRLLIWEWERPGNLYKQMNTVSSLRISSFNLRGFSKNDPKLQMVKLLTATKFHDIMGMLDTRLNQEELDTMVKNNDLSLIPSQSWRIIVLLRKSYPFKLVKHKDVTFNRKRDKAD